MNSEEEVSVQLASVAFFEMQKSPKMLCSTMPLTARGWLASHAAAFGPRGGGGAAALEKMQAAKQI